MALEDATTLNPIIMAFDALAKTTSDSVMAPIPLLITLTETSCSLIFSKAFFTASSEPRTSAFKTTLISLFPASTDANKSSSDTFLSLPAFILAASFLFSATDFASASVSKAINLSPADGFSVKPVISTGVDGPASTIDSPRSFFIVLTLA